MALQALPKLPVLPKAKLVPSASGGSYDTATSTFKPAPAFKMSMPGIFSYGGLASPTGGVPGGASGVPGSGGGGGFTSYLDELQGDPMYQSALDAFNQAIGGGRTALVNQIKQAIIRGGWDLRSKMPSDLLAQYGGDIDQATLDAASGNPLSTRAQLNQQLGQGQSDLNAQLAARGILNSGALGVGNTQLQQGYDKATYDSMNALLDAINQGTGNFAQFTAEQTLARNQAYENAASRLAQLDYGIYGGGDGSAGADAGGAGGAAVANPNRIVSTRTLANGSTLTTYANGRQVQQAPGKSAYVVKR